MLLSGLQQYILLQCLKQSPRKKAEFVAFYQVSKVDKEIALKDIVKSIDRLVARDLLKARGVKTAKKWYTDTVSLTPKGRKKALSLIKERERLPNV